MRKLQIKYTPVFIVSAGRSGSTMIAKVLGLHKDIFALHEPHPHLRTEAFLAWKGSISKESIKRKIRKKRDDLMTQVAMNHLVYVESSNYLSMLIEELYELYEARFVHLYRNGLDFVVSGLQRDWYIDNSLKTKVKDWFRRRYFLNTGKSANDNLLEPPEYLKSRVEKIAWLWVEINNTILKSFKKLPLRNTFSLQLENICENKLRELLSFIGGEANQALIEQMIQVAISRPNKSRNIKIPKEVIWTEENLKRFYSIAGNMMKWLGYE